MNRKPKRTASTLRQHLLERPRGAPGAQVAVCGAVPFLDPAVAEPLGAAAPQLHQKLAETGPNLQKPPRAGRGPGPVPRPRAPALPCLGPARNGT